MRIGLISLGCPKNLVDGEVMLGLARAAGHQVTSDAAEAEVLIVNTCAFIDAAKRESVDAILEMAVRKREGNGKRLVVTGCLAERYRDELRAEIPEIDAVLGTGEVPQILGAIEPPALPLTFFPKAPAFAQMTGRPNGPPSRRRRADALRRAGRTTDRPKYLYDAATPRVLSTPNHFAYIKVAEGCDYTCAFCIIPRLRGAYRSRTIESIVREAHALVERGVRELLLVSQDTTFFGRDRGERGALAGLLRRLNAVDGLTWIRLLYLYPTTITDDVLGTMAECDKVCRYVDLPLQHAAAPVLKRMRRPGNRRTYSALLERIRRRLPGVTLRTTFITGFPGETAADFAELDGFLSEIRFDHVGVFTYSHEEGTRAYGLPDDVPAAIKRRRRRALMSRQKRIVARAQKARVGSLVDVMVDGPSLEHDLVVSGRLEGQAPDIDPVVYLTDCDPTDYPPGRLIRARIVDASGYDLLAVPVV